VVLWTGDISGKGEVMKIPEESDETEFGLPDSVKSSLKDRYGPISVVSSEIDRAILADARQYLSAHVPPVRKHQRWRSWKWSPWKLTAIASTMVAASVMFLALRTPPSEPGGNPSGAVRMPLPMMRTADRKGISKDIDQNGQVDILDAFAMARFIRDGRSEGWDVNGDGRFDQEDVDLVASEAVML